MNVQLELFHPCEAFKLTYLQIIEVLSELFAFAIACPQGSPPSDSASRDLGVDSQNYQQDLPSDVLRIGMKAGLRQSEALTLAIVQFNICQIRTKQRDGSVLRSQNRRSAHAPATRHVKWQLGSVSTPPRLAASDKTTAGEDGLVGRDQDQLGVPTDWLQTVPEAQADQGASLDKDV
ncbi:hypothetical protein ON010_g6078 [Phytophthora cinnamomi]|nr:hypothetical protein ON010_g6078 [Phytophthora cinnamomi]